MDKLGVLIRISDYLEWMYDNAEDDEERRAVSHVEDGSTIRSCRLYITPFSELSL